MRLGLVLSDREGVVPIEDCSFANGIPPGTAGIEVEEEGLPSLGPNLVFGEANGTFTTCSWVT